MNQAERIEIIEIKRMESNRMIKSNLDCSSQCQISHNLFIVKKKVWIYFRKDEKSHKNVLLFYSKESIPDLRGKERTTDSSNRSNWFICLRS